MNRTLRAQNRDHLTIAFAAGGVFALGLGLRQAQPLFISALNSHTGIGYATISLAFGVAQLMWGVAQPVAGVVADRWGPRWVMIAGVALLAAANVATPFAGNAVVLTLLIGVLAAVGAGAIGPAMLISAANQRIPEAKRSVMTGIINAGGSFGQFTIIPLAQLLIGIAGWQPAMVILGVGGLAAVPLVMAFTASTSAPAVSAASNGGTLGMALHRAIRDPSFLLLNAGFFTCGFHVAFIATHLPGVVALCGMPPSVSAWSLSIIGLFNILGSLWIGKTIQTVPMKYALPGSTSRGVLILAFFFAVKTPMAFFLFAAGISSPTSTVLPTVG
jgi:MFS family permease